MPPRTRPQRTTPTKSAPGVVVAQLLGLRGPTQALIGVEQGGAIRPATARVAGSLSPEDVGRQVAVMFEGGDPGRPLVMGVVGPWPSAESSPLQGGEPGAVRQRELEIDVERLLLSAKGDVVIRCGKASITLTRAGKVLIRGTYVSSRSSGVNRVNGGSVRFN